MKIKFATLLLITTCSVLAQGPVDGYFKGKGNLDLAFSAAYQQSDNFFMGDNEIPYARKLTSFSLFGEYGVLKNLDIIGNIPVINGGIQDVGFYVKYGLPLKTNGKDFPLSIIPAVGISAPITKYPTQTGQAIGQRATQIQSKLVLQLNTGFGLFIQAQGGYNYVLDPVPSAIPVSAKIGYATGKLYADVWFDYQKGLGSVDWIGGASQDFRTLNVSYQKIGGVIYYGLKPKIGVFVNGAYILSGRNIGKAYTVGAGFVYKFDFIKETVKKADQN